MEFVLVLLILLLIISATAADDYITREGCVASCGNIRIPYPFGIIGVPSTTNKECYRKGFGLWCDSTTNRLFLAANGTATEVVTKISVDPPHVVIDVPFVAMPAIKVNDTSVAKYYDWIPLKGGPYTLSSANSFYLVGSNVRTDLVDLHTGEVVSSCSSVLYEHPGNRCGLGCCSISIPLGLKSYSIHFERLDHSPANKVKAFLSSAYTFSKPDLNSSLINGSAVVPVKLDWAITDKQSCEEAEMSNFNWRYACASRNSYCHNHPNGLLGYYCKCSDGYRGNPYIDQGCQVDGGCPASCGDVNILYPFGIINYCHNYCYRQGFGLFCNSTTNKLYLAANGTATTEVVTKISLDPPHVMIDAPFIVMPDIKNYFAYWASPKGPYTISSSNKFNLVGSDVYANLVDGLHIGEEVSSCSSGMNDVLSDRCGVHCCSSSIPRGLKSYRIHLKRGGLSANNVKAFLSFGYTFSKQDLDSDLINGGAVVPVMLDWTITDDLSCDEAEEAATRDFNFRYACANPNTYCMNQMVGFPGYYCQCSKGYQGNPYIGCQDIDVCSQPEKYICNGICKNSIGSYSCVCPPGTHGNPTNGICYPNNKQSLGVFSVVIGVSIGVGLLLLSMATIFLHRRWQERSLKIVKEKHFRKNRGLLLQKLISHDDVAERTKIFFLEELETATNNFDDTRILGRGGHGIVFKFILSDQRVVAIKKSKIIIQSEIDQFINEVVILSQLNHRNVVKLFGCCLETEVPLLVYEFVSNGTLSDHIHLGEGASSLSWGDRVRIAREAAGALAYLHSAASISIFHRDVKSSNILLDDNYTAKVSDFGASRSVPLDQTRVVTVVQGTFGYLDPEYYQTCHLTQKSDVYSFGVILVELLTGEKPICFARAKDERNLSIYFLSSLRDCRLFQIIEARLMEEATKEELVAFAKLVEMCIKFKGAERPTMEEVEASLGELARFARQRYENNESLLRERFDAHYGPPTYRNSNECESQDLAWCSSLEKMPILSLSNSC